MKKTFIFFTLLSTFILQAQDITTIVDIDFPSSFTVHNENIYISSFIDGRVKASLVGNLPATYSVFDSSFIECLGLIVHNDILYIAATDSGYIYKTDLTTDPLTRTLFTITDGVYDFAIKDDYLYFSTFFDGKIQRINLASETIVIETILSGLDWVSGIAISGDELYFCERNTNKVSKINLTESNPTPLQLAPTNIIDTPRGIAVDGTDVYVAETLENRISKIDLADGNAVTRVMIGLSSPGEIEITNDDLYISEGGGARIIRVPLSDLESLSVNENEFNTTLTLSPNPSNSFIQIAGLQNDQAYSIYNIFGKKITSNSLRINEKIDIQKLQSGMYFLKLESGAIFKFVKR